MVDKISFVVIFVFVCTILDAQQIILDEKFSDWTNQIVYTDPLNDGSSSGLDFENIGISNDDRNLYIYFELNKEISLQEDNNLYLYIDIDNNINTGQFTRGIGADLAYALGQNQRSLFLNNFEWFVNAFDIGYVGCPTVTSDRFELKISRTLTGGNNTVQMSGNIKVIIEDNIGGGDVAPDNSGGISYTMSDASIALPSYSLERQNADDIRFLSWNVLRDNYFETGPREAINRVLTAVNPDVIAFQEIYDHSATQTKNQVAVALNTPSADLYAEKIFPDIILVSKFPIIDVASANGTGNGAFKINDGTRDWLIISVHLPCCDNDTGREEEVERILSFIEDAKNGSAAITIEDNTPILIMGDTNFVGFADQPITLQQGLNEGPDWGGEMEDLIPYTTGEPATFTWYDPFGNFFSPGRLDYVIYSGSVVRANNSLVLFTESMEPDELNSYGLLKDDTTVAADHLPVIADFDKEQISSVNNADYKDNTTIGYYPNPSSDMIYFDQPIKSIQIYNLSGSLAFSHIGQTEQVNIFQLQSGFYTATVTISDNQKQVIKLVKN